MHRILTTSVADVYPHYRSSITGVVYGVRVGSIGDPLMQKIRCLDRLVDELAEGRPTEKVRRA